jgi:hypothetical protein
MVPLLTQAVQVPYGTGAGLKIVPEPATQIGLLCILAAQAPTMKLNLLQLIGEPAPLTSGTCARGGPKLQVKDGDTLSGGVATLGPV